MAIGLALFLAAITQTMSIMMMGYRSIGLVDIAVVTTAVFVSKVFLTSK
jgi:hypothetical protein